MCKCKEKKQLKLFVTDDALLPEFKTSGAACFDMKSDGDYVIESGEAALIPSGVFMDIPEGYGVDIFVRSSTAIKKGLMLTNSVGIIDSDYVDEVRIPLFNYTKSSVKIDRGERIAQGRLVELVPTELVKITEKPQKKGNRSGGIGSTGDK